MSFLFLEFRRVVTDRRILHSVLNGNYCARLWQTVHYCNMIHFSMLTEEAVVAFTVDLLIDKGPIAIGEIGKSLSEVAGITNISHRISMKYGGL